MSSPKISKVRKFGDVLTIKFPKESEQIEQKQWLCETQGGVYMYHFKNGKDDYMLAYYEVFFPLCAIECFCLVTISSLDPFILGNTHLLWGQKSFKLYSTRNLNVQG